MSAIELIRVIAVHAADKIRRVLWELPLRSRSWTPCGIGQLLSLAIVDAVVLVRAMFVMECCQLFEMLVMMRVCDEYIDTDRGLLRSYIVP